ncbi:MAG TPA: hypothetical protein VH143_22385 [Kofleriaceae bacterium]|jgi:hypothetical protein|nr:hypothetical protein [Kofleriaceae bacterium]
MTRFLVRLIAVVGLAACTHGSDDALSPDAAAPEHFGSAHLPQWTCGDGICEFDETPATCPADCDASP